MIKAVFFDMDGVIIDSERNDMYSLFDIVQAENQAISWEDLLKTVGASWQSFYEQIGQMWQPQMTPHQAELKFGQINRDVRDLLFPHVKKTLSALRHAGIRLAVVSSSPLWMIEEMCEVHSLCFDELISGHDLPQTKPDPQVYLNALNKMGLKPEEVIVVEDSVYGIQAGLAAGMRVVAMDAHELAIDQSAAEQIFPNWLALRHFLMKEIGDYS